jgi:hypothetical protein
MATDQNSPASQDTPPLVATAYERWTLDSIIELVQLIAIDFVNRPRQYREVPPNTSALLQKFRLLTGADLRLPSQSHRSMTFEAILGTSDGTRSDMKGSGPAAVAVGSAPAEGAQFKMSSARLRDAARAYTERQATQGEGQLLQAFVDEASTLQSYLRPIDDGNSVVIGGNTQTKAIFDDAVLVLRDKTVAGRFGRPPATQKTWPLNGALDENGSLLIQEISKVLIPGTTAPSPLTAISQTRFAVMQRVANYGALTIAGVLRGHFSTDAKESVGVRRDRFEPLISAAYSWKTALDNLATAV